MSWKRSQQRKNRLVRLYNKTKYNYGSGVWYNEDSDRYYRYYVSGHGGNCSRTKFLKQMSRRKVRRNRVYQSSGKGHYRKLYDLWWELF